MIRKMNKDDRELYLALGQEFYSSPAVMHSIPVKHFEDSFLELCASDRYLEGYILEHEGCAAGYAMVAKTFSTEAGGLVLWLDEVYIRPDFQGLGLGSELLEFLKGREDVKRIRLETEAENLGAQRLYRRHGFKPMEYLQFYLEK